MKIILTKRERRRARREFRALRREAIKKFGLCDVTSLLNSYARWYF